jgi:hypothetical protein
MTVTEAKFAMKEKVVRLEPIDPELFMKCNPVNRLERMQDETRKLVGTIDVSDPTNYGMLHEALDVYDHLAIDFVYGDELEWDDSMAARNAKRIVIAALNKEASE